MEHLIINFSNIHCEDCEFSVREAVSHYFLLNETESRSVLYEQNGNRVDLVRQDPKPQIEHNIKPLMKRLRQKGFEVVSWEYSLDGQLQLESQDPRHKDLNPDSNLSSKVVKEFSDILYTISDTARKFQENKAKHQHLKTCRKCQMEAESDSDDKSLQTIVQKDAKEFRVVFYVGGMTCASCVQAVSQTVQQIYTELGIPNKEEPNFSVNLIQHSAVAIVPNKHVINTIMTAIEDSGFECKVLEVLPVERSINSKVTAAIGGMTCAACANSISSAVEELNFVLECNINTVTKTGIFVMDDSKSNLDILKERVEDCGFDFEVLEVTKINYVSGKKQSRSIHLSVEGMFCNHCPELINEYLSDFGEAIVIEDELTLKHPFIKFTYVPNTQTNLTLRRILEDLNHLRPSDTNSSYMVDYSRPGLFKCELIIPMTMDEHLRRLAKQEVWKIARRLILAVIFAIPTFVFGVVAMSLLPKSNNFRKWAEKPLWAGNVSTNTWILLILSTPVYFFAADVFHRKAIVEIKSLWIHKNSFRKRLFKFGSMNLLMSLGTSVAYWASIALLILGYQQSPNTDKGFETTYFDSVVFLTFFLLIGRLLESISKNKTGNSIIGLGKLKATSAVLVEEYNGSFGGDHSVDSKFLEVDDFIRISPGDSPPVDCVIIENEAEFDESALTGESTPVKHSPGHQVFSGTVNVSNQSVVAKILSLESDSLIDQIVNTVREGQLRKAPIERLADTLTGYFVPAIVMIAIIVFIIWMSLSYSNVLPASYLDIDIGGWTMWSLEFSIAVFVIACPCGIGLAAPTALFVGSGLAAKYGILVKGGGAAFQDGANTKIVCFDKTGTLTMGELGVSDYAVISQPPDKQMWKILGFQLARDLELSSKHPLGEAIKRFINNSGVELTSNKVPRVETIPGKGLKGDILIEETSLDSRVWRFKPSRVLLGNESLMNDYNVTISSEQKQVLNTWKSQRKSVILIALECETYYKDSEFHLILMLGCRDQIRPESKTVIAYLKNQLNIESWMITGDNKITALAIAKDIGIEESHVVAEVLPSEKQDKIKAIKALGINNIVAMVGDGINDAPALATADIGIALSTGTDLAVTSSDFILLNKNHPLSSMVTLFDLAKTVFRRVKFNFGWALIYNTIGIPIAAGVIYPIHNSRLNPVWASAAMAASSVSVVLSSLALNWYKPKMKVGELEERFDEEVNEVELS